MGKTTLRLRPGLQIGKSVYRAFNLRHPRSIFPYPSSIRIPPPLSSQHRLPTRPPFPYFYNPTSQPLRHSFCGLQTTPTVLCALSE
ncbi:hypothetical protein HNY73_004656 [Argiope bruennichi]|uniref:Uncharacterized protein n=1 Tax=Argiope bruennichi TaxID=94029 RepID=A0A8T0FPM7_ARGBR|nr:hypothetical protein HNY73_004656 [Argiope bruennichi]